MRSALVTILVVLQQVAQLPCRSVTRGRPTTRSSVPIQEDLDAIVARNKEITDLLIPLLEANLEAKKYDQNVHNDLIRVLSDQAKKDPVVQLVPISKHKSKKNQQPLTLIVSKLNSQKNNKRRNKSKIQKARQLNMDKDSFENDVYRRRVNKVTASDKNEISGEDSEESGSLEETHDVDVQRERNDAFDNHSHLNINDLIEKSQQESYELSDEDEYGVLKKRYRKIKNRQPNNNLVGSQEDNESNVSEINDEIRDEYENSISKEHNKSDLKSSEERSTQNSNLGDPSVSSDETKEETADDYSDDDLDGDNVQDGKDGVQDENDDYVADDVEDRVVNDDDKSKQTNRRSGEVTIVDISEENNKPTQSLTLQSHNRLELATEEYDNDEISSKTNKIESQESHKTSSKKERESNSSEKLSRDEDVSNESESLSDSGEKSKELSDRVATDVSEENGSSEESVEREAGDSSEDDRVTNENNISLPDQYASDYLDVSDYYANVPVEEEYDDFEDKSAKEGNNLEASDESDLSLENYYLEPDDENESEDHQDIYVEDDDSKYGSDNDLSVADDNKSYSVEWEDDEIISIEPRGRSDEKLLTLSQEIANKYARDSKYSVENDISLVESSNELDARRSNSIQSFIQVPQIESGENGPKCKHESNENVLEKQLDTDDTINEIHKSYKLSFKFNK